MAACIVTLYSDCAHVCRHTYTRTCRPLHVCIDDYENFGPFFDADPLGVYNSTGNSTQSGGHCIELMGWGVDKASGLPYAALLYIGSISASPTACLLRGYGRAGTQNDRLGEAVILSTGASIPAQ